MRIPIDSLCFMTLKQIDIVRVKRAKISCNFSWERILGIVPTTETLEYVGPIGVGLASPWKNTIGSAHVRG